MNARNTTLTIGATVGGMLAAALLPMAAAHADDGDVGYFGFTLPDSDAFTTTSGFPPLFQEKSADDVILGYDSSEDHSGVLSNADFSADGGSGTIEADVDTLLFTPLGISSRTITLNEDLTTDGAGTENGETVAGEGSVFTVTDFGLGFGNVYVDAVDAGEGGANEVSDLLITPLGNINLSVIVGGLFEVDAADTGVGDSADIDIGTDLTGGLFSDEGLFSGFDVGSALIGGLLGGLVTGNPTAALIGGLLGGLLGGDDGLLDVVIGGLLGGDLLGGLLGGDLLGGDLLGGSFLEGGLLEGGLGDILGGLF